LPYCVEEELPHYLEVLKRFFNEELHEPLRIYLADEEGVEYLGLKDDPEYFVKEEEDLKDYLYDGESMRTLAGKKLTQKRNQINKFHRAYEGRWEYRSLTCSNHDELMEFSENWFAARIEEEEDVESLICERNGIREILNDCCRIPYRAGGLFIDGKLEAFSIGTENFLESMAVISIEKANAEYQGIYQMINQQFLLHEFPSVTLVNREDDMGLPGLRQAKSSYQPVGFARKYMVVQKMFDGEASGRTDSYEREIRERETHAEILRTPEEKLETKDLYIRTFSEDPAAYVEHYYAERCRDNLIVIARDQSEILSMLHLNPYTLSVCGKTVQTYMIAAVATDLEHRHEGLMREVFKAALKELRMQKVPFVYLLPVDERIYEWLGFQTICDVTVHRPEPSELSAYDIYEVETGQLRRCREIEAQMPQEENDLPEHPVIMAKIIDREAFDQMAGERFEDDEARLSWLAGKKCCFTEPV
ncbi:MAG: GNAT family N-acetyltransferase, partial [Lachnospiraceae bacterium]|nr:GNAT family N-acetyltransferase [Lachnospiraceae bacterium]